MTLTKLVDFFAHSFVKTMEGRYSIRTGLAVVALLALGVAAAARNLAKRLAVVGDEVVTHRGDG